MAISRIAMLPRAQEREMDKSVVDVAEEIRKIVTDHRSVFLRIQLVIVLPITAMMMLSDYIFQKSASTLLPVPTPRQLAYSSGIISFGRFSPPAKVFSHILLSFQTSQVTLTLIAAIAVGWFNLFASVHYIVANVYAVVSFHKGKDPTFMDVLQVIPKLRSRLMVTGYWGYLFIFAASLPLLLFDFMTWVGFPTWIYLLFFIIIAAVCLLASFLAGPICQIANCISFCEENTGLTAFMKSVSLFDRKLFLKASVPVELFLRGLGSGVYSAVGVLQMGSLTYGFSVVADTLFNSLITQLAIVCWTFVYIWIKEYHDESLDIVAIPDDQFTGQFQRVGTKEENGDFEDCAELSYSLLKQVYIFIFSTLENVPIYRKPDTALTGCSPGI
ncbi:hypothetical protein R1flu_013324 [Riccia fluitans]|uniref:Gustatory receptor n=1 Tax=Riccia fluitans TaxID=41844 RepID=A0ABD1YD03_9MARC